jgi:excisionase family DNA binding protein
VADETERRDHERRAATRDRLLTPGEVASLFRVDPKTVTRWASAGRISSIRTPGGHRRFRESEVRALLRGEGGDTGLPQGTSAPGSTALGASVPLDLAARRLAR